MPFTIAAEKAALRRSVKDTILPPGEKAHSDTLLLERFLALSPVVQASSLLLFYGVDTEPDTVRLLEPLAAMGKTLALPRCLPHRGMEARLYRGTSHLLPGPFGIPEPDTACPVIARDRFDVILVPALCCDRLCYRLGHGGGYYDRYLSGYSGLTVALCRDKLLQTSLPADRLDIPVGLVLTETVCLSSSPTEKSGA